VRASNGTSNPADAVEPWQQRPEWAARRVAHVVSLAGLALVWGFAFFWYGFLALVGLVVWTHPPAGGTRGPIAVLAFFAAAGLLLLVLAVRGTWHRLRFGRSWFDLDDAPFRPGGWLSGVVRAPAGLDVDAFAVALDCVEVWQGVRNSTHRQIVWRDEVDVGGELVVRDRSAVYIPVSIAIPDDARPTSGTDGRRVEWCLTVRAARPGLDYDSTFEVPVYTAEGPVPGCMRTPSPRRPADVKPRSSRIRVEPRVDGADIQYPSPSWLTGWIVAPILVVAGATVAGVLLFPNDTTSMLVCGAVGLGLAALLLSLTAFGLLTTPNRVEIHADAVLVRRGLLGRGWDRRIPRADVMAVKHVPLQNGPRVDYTVDIHTRDARSYNAALGLRDLSEARWLAHEIARYTHVPPEPEAG
jgi:hypothetical protein